MARRVSFKLIAGALFVAATLGGSAFTLYTDLLFFSDVGYTSVFVKT